MPQARPASASTTIPMGTTCGEPSPRRVVTVQRCRSRQNSRCSPVQLADAGHQASPAQRKPVFPDVESGVFEERAATR